jgi:serine/threonine protein phosphatase 1
MSTSGQRQIIIGDVHGHYQGLMNLLDTIAPSEADQIYFLGDLIDRGPQSAQVVDFVRDKGYLSLLGNHEQMLIDAFPNNQIHQHSFQSWLYAGGNTTIDSYGGNTQHLLEHVQWMRTLPLYWDIGDAWLVHAGVDPRKAFETQSAKQFCWIRDEFHFSPIPYFPDKTIITGHTITFTLPGVAPGALAQGAGWLNIETGAYHPKSGWLTGLDWTTGTVYQANVFDHSTRCLPLEKIVVSIRLSA